MSASFEPFCLATGLEALAEMMGRTRCRPAASVMSGVVGARRIAGARRRARSVSTAARSRWRSALDGCRHAGGRQALPRLKAHRQLPLLKDALASTRRKPSPRTSILLTPRRPHSLHVSDARFALFNIKRDIPRSPPKNGMFLDQDADYVLTLHSLGEKAECPVPSKPLRQRRLQRVGRSAVHGPFGEGRAGSAYRRCVESRRRFGSWFQQRNRHRGGLRQREFVGAETCEHVLHRGPASAVAVYCEPASPSLLLSRISISCLCSTQRC